MLYVRLQLAKAINLEVDLESSDENEDILSKSLKSIGSLASDDTDDGDQIVECEISLSDDGKPNHIELRNIFSYFHFCSRRYYQELRVCITYEKYGQIYNNIGSCQTNN